MSVLCVVWCRAIFILAMVVAQVDIQKIASTAHWSSDSFYVQCYSYEIKQDTQQYLIAFYDSN